MMNLPALVDVKRGKATVKMAQIRVLVVDESVYMQRLLKLILESDPEITVIDTASDGDEALAKVKASHPDVVTLAINMPIMVGLTSLANIMTECPTSTVVISSINKECELVTFEALQLGAVDYFLMPGGSIDGGLNEQLDEVVSKVRVAAKACLRRLEKPKRRRPGSMLPMNQPLFRSNWGVDNIPLVAIGVSTGGPRTLLEIIPELPVDFPAPIVIVQQMPPNFTASFAERLNHESQIRVKEAVQGETLTPGCAYVAPGGYQLSLARRVTGSGTVVRLNKQGAEQSICPSVNVLFHSVAQVFGSRSVGVLLSGIGDDGADGMLAIHQAGGRTIAESEETAIIYGMPREAIERGGVSMVLPYQKIVEQIQIEVRRMIDG
ncbi:MAG: chemotaxis response regulator protein-glutamate methylesterase [Chloroflexi bacterium]|nr:chemotaxis response regulator protein-glutamate methylesterase [Chloroflexota bacterium]